MKIRKGYSVLIVGPSGSGKSSILRTALQHEEGGAVVMAPGSDELNSYTEMHDEAEMPVWQRDDAGRVTQVEVPHARYLFAPIEETDFAPSIQAKPQANAHRDVLHTLGAIYKATLQSVSTGDAPPWPVLGLDTFSSMNDFAHNEMMAKLRLSEPPPAISPEGSSYFGGISRCLNEIARKSRAIKGLGVHWIATAHVKERESSPTYAADEKAGKTQQMPLFTGAFREAVPAIFDLVIYTYVRGGEHFALWKPDSRRAAKSRLGDLKLDEKLKNPTWPVLKKALIEARHDTSLKEE